MDNSPSTKSDRRRRYQPASVGQVFTNWTVLDIWRNPKTSDRMARVRCACGTERSVREAALLTGRSKSCGCIKWDTRKKRRTFPAAEIGQVFGYWTVVAEAPPGRNGRRHLSVRCKCGKERVVGEISLTWGKSRSCGCRRRYYLSKRAKAFQKLKALVINPFREAPCTQP